MLTFTQVVRRGQGEELRLRPGGQNALERSPGHMEEANT